MKWLEKRRAAKRVQALPLEGVEAIVHVDNVRELATRYDHSAATFRNDRMRLAWLGMRDLAAESERDAELMDTFAREIREAIGDLEPTPVKDKARRMDR